MRGRTSLKADTCSIGARARLSQFSRRRARSAARLRVDAGAKFSRACGAPIEIAALRAAGITKVLMEKNLPFLGALLKKEQDLAAFEQFFSSPGKRRWSR